MPTLFSPPRVSVILPVYNAEATVRAAVDSVLVQGDVSLEVIAVDDGSTDTSASILASLASRDARVRVLRLPHGGIVSALNAGLAAARGVYYARMDADDLCLPRRFATQAAYLDAHPHIDLVSCRVDFGGTEGGYARYVAWINSLRTPEQIAYERFRESPFAHPAVMYRAVTVQKYGNYADGPFPEDYELWLRWLGAGVRMTTLPQTLLRWNDPPTRLSRTDARYRTDCFYAMKSVYLARWLAEHTPHYPHVTVIGAGKTSRNRAMLLCEHGVSLDQWIDVDPRKIGNIVHGIPVRDRSALPRSGKGFCLAYLAGHGAAEELETFLQTLNYKPGRDYLLVS